MIRNSGSRWAVAGALFLAALSAGCEQVSPAVDPGSAGAPSQQPAGEGAAGSGDPAAASATATPGSAAAGGRQTTQVRRGSIRELLPLTGRVAALDETPLMSPVLGRVDVINVKPGDAVEEGQLLLQADTTEVQRELAAARSRLELGTLRMEQAQSQAQARQRQNELRVEAERVRRQRAIADAQSVVRRAQEEFARVRAGAPAADRRAAEAAVVSARAGVERAQADLVRASAGPSDDELKAADQQVWSARLTLHRAEMDFQRLKSGPDPNELRAAERDLSSAQTAVLRAQSDLERLASGNPAAVTAAERDLQRAQLALRTAQSTSIDSRSSRDAQRSARAARDASIASARLAVQDAQERLNVARQGPPPQELELARRNVQASLVALQIARERYETVQKGPDELTLATANQAVETAKLAAKNTEARYLELAAGPPADRVAAAQEAVRAARSTLISANDRLAEINSRPTRAELHDAEERITTAEVALERTQSEPEPVLEENDPGAYDLVVLQKNVEQDRAQVAALERDLAATNVVAPFTGVVSSVQVRSGDPLDRGAQLMTIARPGEPIVSADVSDEQAGRLLAGQPATVTPEAASGTEYMATIMGLVDGPGGIGKVAQLRVSWPATPPLFGSSIQAIVTLQEKTDVLLLPQRAVRTSGQRRYVEYLDGETRRMVDVTIGIVGTLDAEIVRGLREGQLVLLPPNGAAPSPSPTASVSASPTP